MQQKYLKLFSYNKLCNFQRGLQSVVPRVRFAPSPTGYLHLGGLRTALYNYLFAKSKDGAFILRIEDTDQTRKVEGSIESLIRDLQWVGIECHEGPGQGGSCGPYIQSERLEIYQNHIKKLLDNGSAYHCFCTERRLNILRRDAIKSQVIPKYDNKCRNLTQDEIDKNLKARKPFCIRFKLTQDCQSFEDLIFGGISYDITLNEGDPVVIKGDGYPTYHFANVVDDHLMNITHVLRGVEWQISTTKHLLLYRAFGWKPPQFGHLPLIVNSDGSKLSKRQSDIRVDDYRNNGIFPLALVNYITLSGGGFNHVPGEGVKIKTMDELANEFQLDKISSHPSRLNQDLLQECNRLELKRQLREKKSTVVLVNQLKEMILTKYPNENLNVTDEHVESILNWSVNRVTMLQDLLATKFAFLWILPKETEIDDQKKLLLEKLVTNLEGIKEFEENSIKSALKNFANENQVKYPALMKTLRAVLSGLNEGPSVAEMMHLLGKEVSLSRIKIAVK